MQQIIRAFSVVRAFFSPINSLIFSSKVHIFVYFRFVFSKNCPQKKTPTDCSEGVTMIVALSMGLQRYYSHSIVAGGLELMS